MPSEESDHACTAEPFPSCPLRRDGLRDPARELPAPDRTGIPLNQVPSFDSSTVIDSNNGLLAAGLNKIPGAVCKLTDKNVCEGALTPVQCISQGAALDIKPITTPTPAYDSLVTNGYKGAATIGIGTGSLQDDNLDEVKAVIAGTAQLSGPQNGWPGLDGLKTCLATVEEKDWGTVAWMASAEIIVVTTTHYVKVSSAQSVTGTGVGFNGSTYNNASADVSTIYIGLDPRPVYVGPIGRADATVPHAVVPEAPVAVGGAVQPVLPTTPAVPNDSKTIIVKAPAPTDTTPPKATAPILAPSVPPST